MIVTEAGERYRFVTQPDHAALSGRFARHWGGEAVVVPDPRLPFVVAAETHDQGWSDYDCRPRLDGEGDPVDFVAVDGDDWTDFYARGVDVAADVHPYAGLLVSLHAAGLRRGGYGVRTEILDLSDEEPYASFVDDQEARQDAFAAECDLPERDRDVLDALHAEGTAPAGAVRSDLWKHYLLLQALDSLSLYTCHNARFEPAELGPVPVGGDDTTTLDVTPVGPATLRLDPYPFDVAALSATVPRRVVPNDADDLVSAYYDADVRRFEVTFVA
ncbi:hypothetical protein J2752_000920 [Halarchaeum rubridurum]|uniref:DUF3891 domain-containing protein n=1 Tax=Halarchaeum rubridurum TaxID=489911 RepID=A0A830FY16_9EURY|nr:DUF3891 family protein [Halarchaeum rubridurum]MBP1954039.1 hypothetical protein [Halarchaeum rubridurum]GGM56843.1 hypothetical protein GCM10009017_03780 [Halarchaeum rubridurum]